MLYFSYKSQPINTSIYTRINMGYMGLVEAMEQVQLRALLKWHGMGAVTINGCHMTCIYGDGEKPYLFLQILKATFLSSSGLLPGTGLTLSLCLSPSQYMVVSTCILGPVGGVVPSYL